jgi:PQQ enzyme repeat
MTRRLLIGLMALSIGCNSSGGGGGTGTAGNSGGTAGTSGGTAGTSGGTAGTSGGTAGTTGGTAGTTGGTAGTTGGTAGTSGGTAGTSGGTAGTTGGTAGTTGGTAGTTGTAGAGGRGGTTGTAGRGGTTGTGGATTATSTNVTTFHNNLGRTGVYVDAALTRAAAAGIHVDTTFANTSIMGPVYAQPLYLGGAGTSQPDMVIVTTAQNRVYALNASTGAEVWPNMQYGAPVTTQLDISGSNRPLLPFGVVGTGTIDPATRTLYFNGAQNVSSTIRHRIHAVDLTNGMEKSGWPVVTETAVSAFTPTNQNQRGALALVGGRVFVPYSGHIGDAGDYHGWVMGVSTTTPTDVVSWSTRAACGGIWATGGISSEGSNVIFTTGNTKASASGGFSAPSTYGDGEAVYRLGTSLARTTTAADFWVPSNWSSLDMSDTDISGSAVVLFDAPGATPSALALVLAKDGNAYLLNRTNMGGMSGAPVRTLGVASNQIIQAAAAYTTAMGTYFVFRGGVTGCPTGSNGGLMAVRVTAASPPALTPAWCGGPTQASNPIVSMTNAQGADAIVWVVATNGQVNALNADTGASILSGNPIATATTKGHQSPIIANGRLIHSTDTRVFALTP